MRSIFWRSLPLLTSGALGSFYLFPHFNSQVLTQYKPTAHNQATHRACKSLHQPYIRPFYLPTSLSQCIWSEWIAEVPDTQYTREILTLPDGGSISLDWAGSHHCPDGSDNGRVLIIAHGLTGGSEMGYIRDTVTPFLAAGYRICVVHVRGINKSPLTSPACHYQHLYSDLSAGIEHILSKFPSPKVHFVALGTSLGACSLLKYIAKHPQTRIQAAVSVSNPYNISQCIDSMGYVYSQYLLVRQKENIQAMNNKFFKQLCSNHNIKYSEVMRARSLREFDLKLTKFIDCPIEEFYKDLSCDHLISQINKPVLCIHARDDYITPISLIPKQKCLDNDHFIMVETTSGAHVCFYENSTRPARVSLEE